MFLKRRALRQKRRFASCWQEIRHVCGYGYRQRINPPLPREHKTTAIVSRAPARRCRRQERSPQARRSATHFPASTRPRPQAGQAWKAAIDQSFDTTAPRVLLDAQGRCSTLIFRMILSENRFRFSGSCVSTRPIAARKSRTGRYWPVPGCAVGAAGAADAAGGCGPAGASLLAGSRKKRKNSEFGDSTIVVPVLSSAVP